MASVLKIGLVAWAVFSSSLAAEAANSGCKLASPLPPHCSVQGNVLSNRTHSYKIFAPQRVDSVEDCALLCSRRVVSKELHQKNFIDEKTRKCTGKFSCDYCQSFQFDTKTGTCQLSFEEVDRYVKPSSKSSLVFNDKDCYVCPPTGCDAPFGTNLLDNADFEGDLLGPWRQRKGGLGNGANSTKGFQCDFIPKSEDKGSFGCILEQSFNACPGSTYMLTFDYKTPKENSSKMIRISYGDENAPEGEIDYSIVTDPQKEAAPTRWLSHSHFFSAPTTPASETSGNVIDIRSGFIYYYYDPFADQGPYKFDNFQLVRVQSQIPTKKGAKSLFKNGGFESGAFAPWKLAEHRGNNVISPGIHSKFAVKSHAAVFLTQSPAVKAHTPYLLEFDFVPGPNTESEIGAGFTSGSRDFQFSKLGQRDNRTFQVPFVADVDGADITVSTNNFMKKGAAGPTAIIDNISIKEIDMEALVAGG